MSIFIEDQTVNAGICMNAGELEINFTDDPAYVRSEAVLVDLMHRSIGIIFQNSYHHIGELPGTIVGTDMMAMTDASLTGFGEGGREIRLHAPVKIVKKAAQ